MEEKRTHTHCVTIENREKLVLDGVEDVESFDEENMVIHTNMGVVLVSGSGLHMQKFNMDNGELCIEGSIDEFVYTEGGREKKGLLSKLFG